MPLIESTSKEAFSANVAAERHAGKPEDQAVAIAEAEKRKASHKHSHQHGVTKEHHAHAHRVGMHTKE